MEKQMKTQIPIYRAKKIDSDEYVEGHLIEDRYTSKFYVQHRRTVKRKDETCFKDVFALSIACIEIDQSTLAIHFPNMIDSEGTNIFASLSEDGNGGDIIEHASTNQWSNKLETKVARYDKGHFDGCFMHKSFEAKVTGIKK